MTVRYPNEYRFQNYGKLVWFYTTHIRNCVPVDMKISGKILFENYENLQTIILIIKTTYQKPNIYF